MRFDLHVHTEISPCSRLRLEDILAHASGLGLDGVCLTDHDSRAASRLVREGRQDDGLVVVVGMEYRTLHGEFLVFGEVPGLEPGLAAPALFQRVREAGGAVVAAHPFRQWQKADPALLVPGSCHALEVLNGRNETWENERAAAQAVRAGLPGTGGSDAHSLSELGRMATEFRDEFADGPGLVAALRSGRFRAVRNRP